MNIPIPAETPDPNIDQPSLPPHRAASGTGTGAPGYRAASRRGTAGEHAAGDRLNPEQVLRFAQEAPGPLSGPHIALIRPTYSRKKA